MSKSSFFLDFGILQHSILSSEAARVGWYVEGLMQRYVPQFHVFFCVVVYIVDHIIMQQRVGRTICMRVLFTVNNVVNLESLLIIY